MPSPSRTQGINLFHQRLRVYIRPMKQVVLPADFLPYVERLLRERRNGWIG